MKKLKYIKILIIILFLNNLAFATIINVPADQPTVQAGINTAIYGDTVLVQPGTYIENINFNGKNIVVGSLFLTTQDTSYISQTVIDGNQDGSVVTFESSEDSTAILSGFTITNGRGFDFNQGGGITINNFSNPTIENININSNDTWGHGGGLFCCNSNPHLKSIRIEDCDAFNYGGGIYCISNSEITLQDVTISYNNSSFGGGIYTNNSNLTLTNVIITDNIGENGSGIKCHNSDISLKNCLISGNGCYHNGAIYCVNNSNINIVNSTIAENYAQSTCGGIFCGSGSNISLFNTIMWSDTQPEILGSGVIATYCDIEGGFPGEGNIDEDPLFIGGNPFNYHLTTYSPCIDTGTSDTTGLNLPPWDLDGNERIWDGDGDGIAIIDMGCYEFGAPSIGVDDRDKPITTLLLYQNYPNPMRTSTKINYTIPKDSKVELRIYNIKGQLVKTLVSGKKEAGYHYVIWDGRNENGIQLSNGIYLYKLKAGNTSIIRKMILLR